MVSAELAVARILPIVMTAVCASMPYSLMITIAMLVNTCPTAQFVRKTCFQVDALLMKCHAVTQFIGIVFAN